MKVVDQWVVGYELILKLEDGSFRIGKTSNIYGFDEIDKEEALIRIKGVPSGDNS